jgi:hypothetical protein
MNIEKAIINNTNRYIYILDFVPATKELRRSWEKLGWGSAEPA